MNFMNNMNINNNIFSKLNKEISSLNISKREAINSTFNDVMGIGNSNYSESTNQEKEITMRFIFPNGVPFEVKGKLNEKFSEVNKRFLEKECPPELKEFSYTALHNTFIIDFQKTLFENEIKNNDAILFIKNISKKQEKKTSLSEEEKEFLKNWIKEFQFKKFMDYLKNLLDLPEGQKIPKFNKEIDIDEFMEFIKKKIDELGIEVEEHEHRLIYCLTNFDWECNVCKKQYNKKDARNFCSNCNFNMCESCREKEGYNKMKPFPENACPSNKKVKDNFMKSNKHEHKLVYCRTQRTCISCGWICNICRKDFENDIWSFYCTMCDFDQCCECFGIH